MTPSCQLAVPEMRNAMTRENSEDLPSETTGIPPTPRDKSRRSNQDSEMVRDASPEPTTRSGVRNIDEVPSPARAMPPRPRVPPPPRPAVKAPAAVAGPAESKPAEPPATARPLAQGLRSEPRQAEISTAECTQVFTPNLNNPQLRRSEAPTTPPPADPFAKDLVVPKEPRVPSDLIRAAQQNAAEKNWNGQDRGDVDNSALEEQTCTYGPETIDKLLQGEGAPVVSGTSAADDVTRVGAVPIEAIVASQQRVSNKGVGFEDVTRVYDLPASAQSEQTTSPRLRPNAGAGPQSSTIVIQDNPRRLRWGWLVALSLGVAVGALGWVNRTPINSHLEGLQARLVRGISMSVPSSPAPQAAPVASVEISISVSPSEASLTIDGTSVPNPYTIQRMPDKREHALVARAPGHDTLRRSLRFERDLTVVLTLAPSPAVAAPAAANAKPAAPVARTVARRTPKAARSSKAARPHKPTSAPTSVDCSIPYTVSAAGIKSYKPDCL